MSARENDPAVSQQWPSFALQEGVTESDDVRPSPGRGRAVALAVVAILVGMVLVVVVLLRSKTPSPVCDRIAELRKTNPRDADDFRAQIVTYASKRKAVRGDTPDAQCRSAWRILDETLDEKPATRLLDCLVHATDARMARTCIPDN